jgi:hypothetical protein
VGTPAKTLSQPRPPDTPAERGPQRRPLIHYAGVAILFVGFVAAALVYAFVTDDADAEAAAEIASSRAYRHNLELMGGKFALLSTEFDDWFASLWHGRPLAYTIVVLSLGIAGVCFWVGHVAAPLPDEEDRGRDR